LFSPPFHNIFHHFLIAKFLLPRFGVWNVRAMWLPVFWDFVKKHPYWHCRSLPNYQRFSRAQCWKSINQTSNAIWKCSSYKVLILLIAHPKSDNRVTLRKYAL